MDELRLRELTDSIQALELYRAGTLPDLDTVAAPRERTDLEQLCAVLRALGLAQEASGDTLVPAPEAVPHDDRCGFVGDRSHIWSWAEPLGNRRPRYLLCGKDARHLEVVDILTLDPRQWPRCVVEGVE